MNNLYNKIYNAINEGIVKSLQIDMPDIPINYASSKINDSINIMNYYVNELIHSKGDITESEAGNIYDNINKTYNINQIEYKVKNFNELILIWNKLCPNGDHYKFLKSDVHKQQIFDCTWRWMDTSKALTVILNDDTEIPFSDYNKEDVKFIVIKMEGYDDILIHINKYIPDKALKWSLGKKRNFNMQDTFKKENVKYDYNGWNHTYRNANIYNGKKNNFKSYPVFDYINSIKNDIPNYEAYLPAYGQLYTILNNYGLIDHIFNVINNKDFIEKFNNNSYWSSSELADWSAYCYSFATNTQDHCLISGKAIEGYVLPIFRKKD